MDRAATIAVSVGLLFVRCTFALNPSFDIDQYTHKAWTIRDGFLKGTITSIAQMPDGYLLLGGESGLVRFDGVRTTSWMPRGCERLPASFILALFIGRDGSVWIGYHGGLVRWRDGKVTEYSQFSGYSVRSVIEDQEGTVWAGAFGVPTGRICAIHPGSIQCFGQDGSFGKFVRSLYIAMAISGPQPKRDCGDGGRALHNHIRAFALQ